MASNGAHLLFLTVICISAGSTSSFITVECEANNIGPHGRQSKLECVVRATKDVVNPQITAVIWKKVGAEEPVLLYIEGKTTQAPRFGFADPSWNNYSMDVSLLITNTVVTDEGAYKCSVVTDSGDSEEWTTLSVTAKYSAPTIQSTPTKIVPNTDFTLLCHSDGGHPKGQLRWFDEHDKEWTKSSKMEVTQTDDGLFSLSSVLTLLRGSVFSKYTCSVHNASGNKEGQAAFDVTLASGHSGKEQDVKSRAASNIVAPVLVIGSLIVGLLIVLLYRRKWRRNNRPDNRSESDMEEGEKGQFCSHSDLREGTQ